MARPPTTLHNASCEEEGGQGQRTTDDEIRYQSCFLRHELLKYEKAGILQRKHLPCLSVAEWSACGKAIFETELMWSQMGGCGFLSNLKWKVWDGEWISQKSEKPVAGRGSPSHVLHPWPLAMPRNLNKTPMFWSQASHSLYDSNLGRTWASESIISGLRFIFLLWKKKCDYRNDYFIVNAKLQHIKN